MNKKTASGYRLIFGYLGIFLIVIGVICLLPLLILIYRPDEAQYSPAFYLPGIVLTLLGTGLIFLIFKRKKDQLKKHQDSVLLILIWLSAILFGAIPFMLRGLSFRGGAHFDGEQMGIIEAIFESTSGYSSTGLTRFDFNDGYYVPNTPVEMIPDMALRTSYAPYMFRLYRALIIFFGGIGLVLVVASAISDRYGLKLYTAEGHNDRLMPNLGKSARVILSIYCGYAALGIIAYIIAGMDWFDAICHSFAAIATGGFSTYAGGLADPMLLASLRYGDGSLIAVEIISIVLMLLGATNFVLHLFIFKGKIKQILKDCEIHFALSLLIIFVPLATFGIFLTPENGILPTHSWMSLRYGLFSIVSALTTTGFSNVANYADLGQALSLVSIIMMLIGGGMGSTGGAIKQYRVVIGLKSMFWSIRDRRAPKAMLYPRFVYRTGERHEVTQEESSEALSYILLYLVVIFVGSFLMSIFGASNPNVSVGDCIFEFSSALSGTGLSRISQANAGPGINIMLILSMFAGRLEIIPLHFAFYRITRDIFRKETV